MRRTLFGLRLKVHRRIFAAAIDFQFEVQAVAFVERAHASPFDRTDVDERIRLAIVALDEAKALHRVEELHGAARALTGQLTLRSTTIAAAEAAAITAAKTASTGFARFAWRALGHGKRFALDLQIGRRNLATAIDQGEAELLTFGKAGEASLLDSADMHEHVFAAIVTDDEAKTLLTVEELDGASAFSDDLGRHAAATTAAAAKTAATTAEAATTTAAAAEAAAVTTAEATAIAAKAAAEATAIAAKTTAETATITAKATTEIVAAETVALVLTAPAAASSVKTHALLVTFASPQPKSDAMSGE